ncbi:MAG: hypothetical protein ORN51_00940 [Akkermansiaceae bacterium]|nr:hypothetical protein [Akkermansiaceae bacterium]
MASSADAGEFTSVAERHRIQSSAVLEASGLAVSPSNPQFLWVLNDSGATPDIHLMEVDGTSRGVVRLKDSRNIDWEDLAAFSLDQNSYLLVADIGDNGAKRKSCRLYVMREPTLPKTGQTLDGKAVPAWQIEFRYEDGPRDCEAIGVDVAMGKVILISKRTLPPLVYELPLRAPAKGGVQIARKVGKVLVRSPFDELVPVSNQPTGLTIARDRSQAAVITYYGIFLFPRAPNESWATAFARPYASRMPHFLGQAESVAFTNDGILLYAVSEGAQSPIARFRKQ